MRIGIVYFESGPVYNSCVVFTHLLRRYYYSVPCISSTKQTWIFTDENRDQPMKKLFCLFHFLLYFPSCYFHNLLDMLLDILISSCKNKLFPRPFSVATILSQLTTSSLAEWVGMLFYVDSNQMYTYKHICG